MGAFRSLSENTWTRARSRNLNLYGSCGLQGAYPAREFGRIVNVFNASAAAMGQSDPFEQVLRAAIRVFHVQACLS